jgi:filamentous hemagglutinin family protein
MVKHGVDLSWQEHIVRRFLASVRYLMLGAGIFSLSVAVAFGQPAPNARPRGGTVVAGLASISVDHGVVYITSTSQQTVIEWQSFDIGANQQVVITAPSANATVLNRVIGKNPSQIAGQLNSNGQVYVINGSGITYDKGAQVDVHGFVSTSANIADANFMAGNLIFDGAGSANALIENQGKIKVSGGGALVLIAPGVSNSGVLGAPLGHINLLSAITFALVPYGDGLISLDVTNQLISTIRSDLVVNTGTIRARGGVVQLGVRVADGVVRSVRVGGIIRARTANGQPGTIVVNAIAPSIVVVTGTLDASGTQEAGGVGGNIEVVTNNSTELAATSVVDVSGEVGGGTVAIGTTLARAKGGPGTPSVLTSNAVLVDQGAQISADALAAGNGGRVAVLATTATTMAGTITARGGNSSGNGGFVEVSGGTLAMTGIVDTNAPNGSTGTLLLDPFDFIVTPAIANALSAHLIAGKSGKLVIWADHDIEVDAAIDGRGGLPGTQLTFVAGNQVRLNADVFTNNAPVEIDAGAGGVLASPGTAFCAGAFSITVKSEGSSGLQEPKSCSLPPTR